MYSEHKCAWCIHTDDDEAMRCFVCVMQMFDSWVAERRKLHTLTELDTQMEATA